MEKWKHTLIIFSIVLIHELAHTLVAIAHKYSVTEIELFPFGGVAKIDGLMGANPKTEIKIALAGPIVNVVMASVALTLGEISDINSLRSYFIMVNLSIAIFNMLPLLPLDGGRIVRSYIILKKGLRKGTNIIVFISNIISLLIASLGLYLVITSTDWIRGVFIIGLSLFLYIASQKEKKMTIFLLMKDISDRKDILLQKGVLKTNYLVSTEHTTLKEIVDQFLPNNYHIIAVINSKGQVMGTITEEDISTAIINYGFHAPISVLLNNRKKW